MTPNIPEAYEEALKPESSWEETIKIELAALHKNETWNIVPIPKD